MINNTNSLVERKEEQTKNDESNDSKKVFTLTDLLRMNVREIPMLWEPFIPLGGVSFLVGSSDCGKSTLLRQLATSICRGDETYLGHRLSSRHRRALIVSTEDDEQGVAFSLSRQIGSQDVDFGDRLSFLFDHGNVFSDTVKHLREFPCDLLVIDSWSDTLKGSPNDFTSVRAAIEPWKAIGRKFGCAVVGLHHTVKHSEKAAPDKNRVNGSQGIEAKSRSIMELRHGVERNQRLLSILKGNYASDEAKALSYALTFNSENLSFSSDGATVNKSGLGETVKRKYDWIKDEAKKMKTEKGLSFEEVRTGLIKKYGEEKAPSKTWLKENLSS